MQWWARPEGVGSKFKLHTTHFWRRRGQNQWSKVSSHLLANGFCIRGPPGSRAGKIGEQQRLEALAPSA